MERKDLAALVGEGFGTFLFFFVGCGSVVLVDYQAHAGGSAAGLLGIALAHGIVLAVVASALMSISGGHVNPAVTFGVWLAGKIGSRMAVLYVVAQLIGAVLAGLAVRLAFPESAWSPSHIGLPALGPGIDPTMGIVVEAIMTALLILAVFGTAVDPRAPKVGGLFIGLSIAADILAGGPLTGAAMNPARWFGPAVASGVFDNWFVWIAGPLLGAAVVAALYRYLFSPEAQVVAAA